MNNLAKVRELLEKLVGSTDSPVYSACDEIAAFLEHHPKQRNLTIGGLKAALKKSDSDSEVLIQAAFALTTYPFSALEVRYKLYDVSISNVIEELDNSSYVRAIAKGHFIDDDGNDITVEELHKRTFPYFVNQFQSESNQKVFT
jgi:hypothetical protein